MTQSIAFAPISKVVRRPVKPEAFARALKPRNGALLEAWPSGTWQANRPGFAERIHQLRMWRRIPMEVAAKRAGVSRQAWHKWETGKTQAGSRVLLTVCKGLGVSLSDVVQQQGHQDCIRTSRNSPCICVACERDFAALQQSLIEIDGDIWEDVYSGQPAIRIDERT